MKHLSQIASLLAVGLALTLGACGGGNSCDKLAAKLCDGKDEATCKKTRAWLDSEMTGPDGKKLADSEASAACGMILDDTAALEAYKAQAAVKVK